MNIEQTEKSRTDLLSWLNDLLKVYPVLNHPMTRRTYPESSCQVLELCTASYSTTSTLAKLTKINWKAKNEYEYVQNFKVLQVAFSKQNLSKPIEDKRQIERLIKCKYQDNLEFLQWFKKHFDQNAVLIKDYDPQSKRNGQELEYSQVESSPFGNNNTSGAYQRQNSKSRQPTKVGALTIYFWNQVIQPVVGTFQLSKNASNSNLSLNKENEQPSILDRKISEPWSQKQTMELLQQLESARQERDYYFNKLKDIDSVVVSFKEENVGKLILNLKEILYCTPDKTIQVGEDGNLLIVCEPVQQSS